FLLIVQDAQQTGTLEVLMTTSTPAPVLIFMSAMSAFAGHMVQFVIYVGGGLLLFRVPLGNPNLLGCVLVFLLSAAIAVVLGFFALLILPVSLLVLSHTLRRARLEGTLSFY